jgi:YbbR domain-containing protein
MSVRSSVLQLIVRNWPIKLAAMFFALMLYVAVAAQQPLSQTFAIRLLVTVPPGRFIRQQPSGLSVVITGKGSEILKLRSFPRSIHKVVPDTFSASVWHVQLQPSDIELPKGIDLQVDVRPHDVDVVLDSVAHKEVRVAPRVRVEAESGYVLRGLTITPSVVRLIGPEKSLAGLESVTTVPTVISSVNGPFFRTVPVDTAPLGVVRIAPREVRVAGEVSAIVDRSIVGVPISTAASGFTGFQLAPERVTVTVRGPESRVNMLTRDSLRVVAHLVGKAGPGGYARLTVSAPRGIVARAVPDSVALKRKTGRG